MKVLIVDDEKHVAEAIRLLIPWEEYGVTEVDTAQDVAQAVRLLDEKRSEIAFVDVVIGDRDGSEILSHINARRYQYMPVGCATVLHFLYPTVVCAASALILHERLSGFHLLAVVLSIAGLACISLTSFEASATGIVLAVLSALAYAFYLLALGRRPCGGVPLPVRMFYVFVGGAAITLALLPFFGPVELPPAGAAGALALAGLLSMAAAGMLLAGLRRLSSTTAAFFCLLEPVTSVVLSTVVFRYDFTAVMIAGCALIGASMLCVCAADLRAARRKEARA